MTLDGHPLSIVIKNEETGAFELQEANLRKVLLSPEVADKSVCVVAVAGAFRKGKSFLLDFFLRYLAKNKKSGNWLANKSCPLEGFKWRQGYKRETTGIYIWSKPFIETSSTGEEVAIILMDTQGTFDLESSLRDSTAVFALSLLVSSELVYNLSSNIQEDDLMNLQTFVTYGLQACSDTDDSTPFQKLLFLVRDWGSPVQLPYGVEGGQKLLEEMLEIKPGHSQSNQELRRDLRKCFTEINCYLMPHPGLRILETADFDGRLSDIDQKFVNHLGVLVPGLFSPDKLVAKKIGGQTLRAKDLFEYFKNFTEAFKREGLVEPATITELMVMASSQAALSKAKEFYVQTMEVFVRETSAIGQLEVQHENSKLKAKNMYEEKNKFGSRNKRIYQQYKQMLENEITEIYDVQFKARATSQAALELSLRHYATVMEDLIKDKEPAAQIQILKDQHEIKKQNAVRLFGKENEPGMKNTAIFDEYKVLLQQKADELLEVKFLSEANSKLACISGTEQYEKGMKFFFRDDNCTLTLDTLVLEHENEKRKAVVNYHEMNEIGRKNGDVFNQYLKCMEKAIEEVYQAKYMPRVNSQEKSDDSMKCYKNAMDNFFKQQKGLTLDQLVTKHNEERQKAVEKYRERNALGQKNSVIFKEHLERLQNYIDALYKTTFLPRWSGQSTLFACKSEYKDKMDELVNEEATNISNSQLESFHNVMKEEAIKKYRTENTFRENNTSLHEEFLDRLQQELDELHEMEYMPIVSSMAAVNACFELYAEKFRDCSGERETLSSEYVLAKHDKAKPKAITDYRERNWRGKKNSITFQKHEDLLVNQIDKERDEQLSVRSVYRAAMEESLQKYKDAMNRYLGSAETPSVKEVKAKNTLEINKALSNFQDCRQAAEKHSAVYSGYLKLLEKLRACLSLPAARMASVVLMKFSITGNNCDLVYCKWYS